MLIEFSVQNFKSIRRRQTLSMVAAPRLRKKENTFSPKLRGDNIPPLLKAVAIYGPNASGKSNVLQSLVTVQDIVTRTPSDASPLPVSPFRFDPSLSDQPSQFEIHFVCDDTRYQYDLSATAERIVFERLIYYPKGKEKTIYSRSVTESGSHYEFDNLEGGEELHRVWMQLTGAKTLFISQAVANSSEDMHQLRKPFHWLSRSIWYVGGNFDTLRVATQRLISKHVDFADKVAGVLRDVDVPVSSIVVRSLEDNGASLADVRRDSSGRTSFAVKRFSTTLTHTTSLGAKEFDFEEESEGTKNLFALSIPWFLMQAAFPEAGCHILVVDEFDSSLHPKVVEALIGGHLKSSSSGQLVFTTHDTHLMDSKLLRRDQIWTTERCADGSTDLRSIHDFEGREGEDIEKRYYEGRYRALPHVRGL